MQLHRAGLGLGLVISLLAGPAFAEGSLVLVLGGEAYDGAPRFTVALGDKQIGEGVVERAIDTATAGRFEDADDKSPYLQSFTFPVADADFSADAPLTVTFTNEAFGGEGSGRDRNLYIVSATLNGRVVLGRAFNSDTSDERVGDYLALMGYNEAGTALAPEGGWPADSGDAIAAVPAPETTDIATRPTPVEPVVEAGTTAPDQAMGGPFEPARPDETDADAALAVAANAEPSTVAGRPEEVEVAALSDASVVASPPVGCGLDEIYNVVGFNENSNELTPRLAERLDQIVADIGEKSCSVRIVGYSDNRGSNATNALFAVERAQNVLAYLRRAGVRFESIDATGGGATDQFGDTPGANRRVVITVKP